MQVSDASLEWSVGRERVRYRLVHVRVREVALYWCGVRGRTSRSRPRTGAW